ncbi:MAG: MFS transporter [Anaerolineaceae bacterium]|nr:MFS transporter [Anaerolineaceae bacterium]
MFKNRSFRINGETYPLEFGVLLGGMLVSSMGSSFIWPILTIYLAEKLGVALAAVAGLMTVSSVASIIVSFISGAVADRLGRKWVMIFGLFASALTYLFFTPANSMWLFALLMFVRGGVRPFYRTGADAMVADMTQPEQRTEAYALMRMMNNLGLAIGPGIGGFIAATYSYDIDFYVAAISLALFGVLTIFFLKETLPNEAEQSNQIKRSLDLKSYLPVLRDQRFMYFFIFFTFILMGSTMLFSLLPVYAKEQFQISESQISWVFSANAIMVVSLQFFVTRVTKRYSAMWIMIVGALFYSIGVGTVAFGSTTWAFIASMAVVTIGELMIMPTSSAITSNLAPINSRGKYMSIFGLGYGIASGVGPVLGGLMNDLIAPVAMWIGSAFYGIIGAIGFLILSKRIDYSLVGQQMPDEQLDRLIGEEIEA